MNMYQVAQMAAGGLIFSGGFLAGASPNFWEQMLGVVLAGIGATIWPNNK